MNVLLKNKVSVEIRAAEVRDAQAILDCMSQVIRETKNLAREVEEWRMTVEMEKEFLTKLVESPHEYMAIALDQGKVIATAGFHGKSLQRFQHRVSMGISVLKAYQHVGLGTHLMHHIIEEAQRAKKRTIDLDVRRDNEHAIKLYEKMGFIREGIKQEAFYVDGVYIDLVLMAKHL